MILPMSQDPQCHVNPISPLKKTPINHGHRYEPHKNPILIADDKEKTPNVFGYVFEKNPPRNEQHKDVKKNKLGALCFPPDQHKYCWGKETRPTRSGSKVFYALSIISETFCGNKWGKPKIVGYKNLNKFR